MQVIYENQEKWLENRTNSIGGSECSAVVGLNPYMSNTELWEIKTGQKPREDISNEPYIIYGHKAEELLVRLFELDYPEYEANYNDNYRVNYNDTYNYISCTRDCDLVEKATGRKGALEIKTTEILASMHKEKWKDRVPDNYFCQVLQYFATDQELEFVILKAQLKTDYGVKDNGIRDVRTTTRHYLFERKDYLEDIEFLINKQVEFWKNVQENKRPNLIIDF